MKFNVGDRVKVVGVVPGSRAYEGHIGVEGVVYLVTNEAVFVKDDKEEYGFDNRFFVLELVEKEYKLIVPELPAGTTMVKDFEGDIWFLQSNDRWRHEDSDGNAAYDIEFIKLLDNWGPVTVYKEPEKQYNIFRTVNAGARQKVFANSQSLEIVTKHLQNKIVFSHFNNSHLDNTSTATYAKGRSFYFLDKDLNNYRWDIEEVNE